jgi:hypothetical protein
VNNPGAHTSQIYGRVGIRPAIFSVIALLGIFLFSLLGPLLSFPDSRVYSLIGGYFRNLPDQLIVT